MLKLARWQHVTFRKWLARRGADEFGTPVRCANRRRGVSESFPKLAGNSGNLVKGLSRNIDSANMVATRVSVLTKGMAVAFNQMVLAIGRVTPQAVELLGTGFLVSNTGLVVTMRHVIGDNDAGLCVLLPKTNDLNAYQDTMDHACVPAEAKLKEVDPIRDLAVLSTTLTYQGALPRLTGFDETRVGEPLLIWGFPHATEGRWVLTLHSAIVGAKVLLGSQGIKVKHAIVNIQARPGQSGSLVYCPRTDSTVGVLVGAYANNRHGGVIVGGINPAELHQTTHCISAEYIREML